MNTTPTLEIIYDNGLGDVVTVKTTLKGNVIDDLIDAIRLSLLGMGFSPKLVEECFPEEY